MSKIEPTGDTSMSDWTPTTEQVRDGYRYDPEYDYYNPLHAGANVELRGLAFDRWLKQVKAEAWDEGFADGVNHDLGDWENAPSIINNPYRQETQ